MATTISIESPIGIEKVLLVLVLLGLTLAVYKLLHNGKAEPVTPVCDPFTDDLPPLGHRAFKASELIPRREQENMKQQIDALERNRQAAFTQIGKVYARRLQIDKALDKLVYDLSKEFAPDNMEPVLGMKKKIRALSREVEQCYGIVDDLCHQMHQMMVQRLNLRRKIDRLDLQMESARLAEIMHPHIIPVEALGDQEREIKKRR
ncbi:uncharacterized protein FMAN_11983 [Fusarium mangiferae]|uniref:Uncharacterized protein n=1 Tax=Fusarium mangiferae TaxID=192010 RepID=A0A1L7U941_FUSMA|nr:uncharacterized protein FMAN_11983 [Fusarium mangiferae]CVL06889.1 uncharacterized protein FMAN_11983 [Fusarium mangiferae]